MKQRLLRTALMLVLIFCSSAAWAEKEMYARLSETTLTFYYDENKTENDYWIGGMSKEVAQSITKVIFDSSFADARPTSTASWFSGLKNLQSIEDIANLNTSNVTDMAWMFDGCSSLTSLDLSNFVTNNVTKMKAMFQSCTLLSSLDVSNFDTSKVTDMSGMFSGCNSLTSLDVSNFNTSSVTDMSAMFSGCNSLTSLNLSNFNTSNVTDMAWMFDGCSSLTSLDLSNFVTNNVTKMKAMFQSCTLLSSLDVSNFNTSNVTDMSGMFLGCNSLTSLDVSNFNTSNVTDMSAMFNSCKLLTSLDVSNFNTSNVTNMVGMFYACKSLTSLDVSNFDTSNVTDMYMMFQSCYLLTSLDLSSFNTSNVTNMSNMFHWCEALTSLDVSHFDTSNVEDMSVMFEHCYLLTNLDVSNFNTSKVTNMMDMFCGCESLTSIDVSNFDTRNVTDMQLMFSSCYNLQSLDVSNFRTSNVTSMRRMFENCRSLSTLNLLNFDFSNVINIDDMFYNCTNLETIYCDADLSGVGEGEYVFYRCGNLMGSNGTAYSVMDKSYARPDKEGQPGYFADDVNYVRKNMYARLSGSTLTFYYDGNKTAGDYPVSDRGWSESASTITNVIFDSSFAEARPTSTSEWFDGFEKLQSIEGIANLNTSNVTDMNCMFRGCTALASLNVSNFDTGNVTNMVAMFQNLSSLASLDVSHFDTSNVTDMAWMFDGCSALTSLDLSNFNTSKVTDMGIMFHGCIALASLDLRHFDTSNVTTMAWMFDGCSSLGTILVSDKWSIANVTEGYNMFYGCENLVGCRGTTYSSSHIEYDYAHIDEGESNPGYLSIELILLTAEDVTFGSGDLTYNGSAQMPEVTVTHGGSALTVGTDYSLTVQQKQANDSYADVENAINIGSYKLIVTGIGAYLGTFFKDFTISAKALTDDMVTLSAESFDFNGEAQKPTVTVKDGENTLEEGTDYDLTNEGGINPGTYSAKVDGKGNYCGEVTKTYVIVAETVEEGDVKGAVIDEENKEVILTDIDVEPGTTAVTIPTTIGDYTVVAIAANTLAGMTDVTDINLPETEEPLGLGTNALRIDDTHVATVHTPLALLDDYALNTQLQQNFEAGKVTAVVTAPNKYWTFSCGVDVLLPDGVGVYTCHLNSTKTAIEITQIDDLQLMVDGKKVIKANNGVLVACIDGTGGNAYDIVANPGGQESGTEPATTDAKSYGLDNQLEPVIKSANYAAGNYYVLVDNEFHPIIDNSSEVPACKAVLKLPTMVAASRGLIIVGNNDGTTGISGVSMEAVKSDWFDLNGHRIERPTTKGVFINNGKIVIIK